MSWQCLTFDFVSWCYAGCRELVMQTPYYALPIPAASSQVPPVTRVSCPQTPKLGFFSTYYWIFRFHILSTSSSTRLFGRRTLILQAQVILTMLETRLNWFPLFALPVHLFFLAALYSCRFPLRYGSLFSSGRSSCFRPLTQIRHVPILTLSFYVGSSSCYSSSLYLACLDHYSHLDNGEAGLWK